MKRYYPRVSRTAHDEHAVMFVHPEGGYVHYHDAQEAIKDAERFKLLVRIVVAAASDGADDPKLSAAVENCGEKEMPETLDGWRQFLDEVAAHV